MLALAPQGLDALRDEWGAATVEAVLAELAMHLRVRLAPSDVLGQAAPGLFVVCLFHTTEALAARQLQVLQDAVAADRGLHPGGQQPLQVLAVLRVVGSQDDAEAAYAQACQAVQVAA